MHAHDIHAREMHTNEIRAIRCTPMMYTPMRCTPVRCTPMRCTPVRALHRMKQDAHSATTEEDVGQERFNWHWIRMALLSPNTWFCSLAWFFLLIPYYIGSSRGH